MLGVANYNKIIVVNKIIQVILPLWKMRKKKFFPEGPKGFGLLVTRFEGKHYPNAGLELLFISGQLVLVTWPSPQTTQRVTGKCSYKSLDKWAGDVNQSHWRLQASLGNAIGKSSSQYMAFFFFSLNKIAKVKKVSQQISFLRGRKLSWWTWERKTQC